MSGRSYTNQINTAEVDVSIERLLIAPFGTVWNPSRVDISSPPSGFYDLGAVVEDSPTFKGTRKMFELMTGIPEVLQYQFVQSLSGEFDISLHSNNWSKFSYMVANYTYTDTTGSIGYVRQAVGTSQILYYALLGVADFVTNHTQVVHYMQRATSAGDIEEKITSKENERLALKFKLYGYTTTGIYSSCSELIIAERFFFPASGSC